MSPSVDKSKDDQTLPGLHLDKSSEYVGRTNSAAKLEDPYKYKKSYSAEDANKRFTDQRQDFDQIYSPQTAKVQRYRVLLLLFLTTVLCVLIGATIYMCMKEFPPDEITRPHRQAGDISRKHAVVMSDNLECSIYMKSLLMQNVDPRHVMFHGIMCLAITEPHSVATDSAISSIWFYRQERELLTENILSKTYERGKCQSGVDTNRSCTLGSFMYIRGKYTMHYFLMFSEIFSQYVLKGKRVFTELYQQFFEKFYGEKDHGDYVYPEIRNTRGYSQAAPRTSSFLRRFRVSKLFETTLTQVSDPNFFKKVWREHTYGLGDMLDVRTNGILSIGRQMAQYFMYYFFVTNVEQDILAKNNEVVHLPFDPTIANFSTSVAVNGDYTTFGWMAETVVDLVNEANRREKLSKPALYAAVPRAQKFAYYQNVEMEGFQNSSMLSDLPFWENENNTIDYVLGKLDKKFEDSINCTMLMKQPSRVATIINWIDKEYTFLNIVSMALPTLFGSFLTQEKAVAAYPKFECGGHFSVDNFTSSASLVITKNSQNRKFIQGGANGTRWYNVRPWIAVSASGSIRTVEAVSITALRILLFKESPARAVNAPGAYYDVRDGKFYCDKGRSDETKKMFEHMEKEFHLECLPVPEKEFMANDRVAMAAQMGYRQNDYIRSAVDRRALDFNYPVGY